MSLTIRCDRSTGVVEPSGEIIFEFVIADENGQPAAGQPIEVKPPSSNAVCVSTASERTGDDGKARIVVRGGAAPAKVDFAVRIGPLTQPVTAYVTNVHIDLPLGDPKLRDLKSEEEALLQMLFWNQERVSVLRQFGGGMSGSRVLQVESVGAHGAISARSSSWGSATACWKNGTVIARRSRGASPGDARQRQPGLREEGRHCLRRCPCFRRRQAGEVVGFHRAAWRLLSIAGQRRCPRRTSRHLGRRSSKRPSLLRGETREVQRPGVPVHARTPRCHLDRPEGKSGRLPAFRGQTLPGGSD